MTTEGLLFRLEADWDKEDDLARFLETELPALMDGLPLTGWYSIRFGPTSFGVFDAFTDEAAERGHVGDRIAAALKERSDLLKSPPAVESFDVLAPPA
ncbi:MAG: hypothetical protein QOF37_1930 [Thermoleophilaceae bacterium]|jgi:hypothetical protein|nr:hypothetical protein [Thermoleophilaceae bacterium]